MNDELWTKATACLGVGLASLALSKMHDGGFQGWFELVLSLFFITLAVVYLVRHFAQMWRER